MTRIQEINGAADDYLDRTYGFGNRDSFIEGAEWADKCPATNRILRIEDINIPPELIDRALNEPGKLMLIDNPSPWISVELRLPEKINKFLSEPVLCRYKRDCREYYHVAQYDYELKEWTIYGVTHWMPIPELPTTK